MEQLEQLSLKNEEYVNAERLEQVERRKNSTFHKRIVRTLNFFQLFQLFRVLDYAQYPAMQHRVYIVNSIADKNIKHINDFNFEFEGKPGDDVRITTSSPYTSDEVANWSNDHKFHLSPKKCHDENVNFSKDS